MTWIDLLGYAASATVLATFCMNTMIPLRVTAILSNILFASFGFGAHIYPVMMLHLILFPVNALRLIQVRRVVRGTLQRTDLSMEKRHGGPPYFWFAEIKGMCELPHSHERVDSSVAARSLPPIGDSRTPNILPVRRLEHVELPAC
jgi:hypothetical protein